MISMYFDQYMYNSSVSDCTSFNQWFDLEQLRLKMNVKLNKIMIETTGIALTSSIDRYISCSEFLNNNHHEFATSNSMDTTTGTSFRIPKYATEI